MIKLKRDPILELDPDETDEFVNNVVDSFRLLQINFGKPDYRLYVRRYLLHLIKKLEETNPGRLEGFKKEAEPVVKKILDDFENYTFYMVSDRDFDYETTVMALRYRSDGVTPYFTALKDSFMVQSVSYCNERLATWIIKIANNTNYHIQYPESDKPSVDD
ncbi:hypothetical protein DFQ26_007681 [Actinomortierella ambigua]|nr:hypothetical protein DFQ26_007681 [Actinomortierella ambigua]